MQSQNNSRKYLQSRNEMKFVSENSKESLNQPKNEVNHTNSKTRKLSFAEIFASKQRIINKNHFQYENIRRFMLSQKNSKYNVKTDIAETRYPPIILKARIVSNFT